MPKKGKTLHKYEKGEHRADLFGHYYKDYQESGKVPKGFHIWPYEKDMHSVREHHDDKKK